MVDGRITLLLVAFITKTSAQFSRELALLWVTGAYCLQLVAHLLVPMLLRLADLRRRRVKARAIVVGARLPRAENQQQSLEPYTSCWRSR
jgi:hypothetical protein